VRRDAIFYQLFQRFPSLLFDLVDNPPADADRYRFASVEVKEPSFRIDGVFLPPDDAISKTVFFVEVQFQKDNTLYTRLFAESMLYLHHNAEAYTDWGAVVIFPSRSLEPENIRMHRSLLNGDQVQRIYLDELGDPSQQPVGISLMQLTIAPETTAVEQARDLMERVQQEVEPLAQAAIMEMITTIAVYKFAKLSREEVEAMLGLQLEDSRILREAKEEGRQEGRQEGQQEGRQEGRQEGEREKALAIALRLLARRFGSSLDEPLQTQVQQLSSLQLEDLSEAVLDFATPTDLQTWLEAHPAQPS
jgi:predicted transposase/invertase (TIGR01784 family)